MKTQQMKGNNNQGTNAADRNMKNQNDSMKQKGISNAGGQRSDQTSSRDSDSMHKPEHRKHK